MTKQEILDAIEEYVTANGLQEITGQILNLILTSIATIIPEETMLTSSFGGIVSAPETPVFAPGNAKWFFARPGDYTNLNLIALEGHLNILTFNGAEWNIEKILISGMGNDLPSPLFEIADSNDKVAFRIDGIGETNIAKFHIDTINRLTTDLNLRLNIPKFAVLGDSISTNNGGGSAGLTPPEIWWSKVAAKTGSTTYINAIGGSCITTGGEPTEDFSSDNRLNAIIASNPNVVFIFGGINDFGQDIPLGVFGSTEKTNFHGALRYVYTKLMMGLPNAKIIHMTPLHMNLEYYTGSLIPEYNGQNYLTDYIDVINQEAKAFGVSVINTNQNSGITQFNINSMASDKIHGNAIFHTMIANCVIREIKKLI